MTDRVRVVNPTAIRQWIGAVGLALQAEDAARGATSVDRSTALILADTAAEAGLALISSFLAEPLQNTDYGTYLARAKRRARLPEQTTTELQAVHKLRNGALHQGAEVGPDDVMRATLIARHVLDIYVPRVLRSVRGLSYGRGVADAVAALLVAHRPIAYRLGQAAHAMARRDEKAALEHISATFYLARMYADPKLPGPGTLVVGGRRHDNLNPSGESWQRSVESWLVPMALGLTPASYARLTTDLPHATYSPGSGEPGGKFHFRDFEPSPGAARRSLETVSLLVLRLWLRDSLRYPTTGQPNDEDDE
jgi:hypothetical protein